MSLVVIGTTGSSSCSRSSIADDGRTEGLRVTLVLMGTTGMSYSNGLECWASWVGVTASNRRPRWRSWLGPGMRSEPIRAEGQVMSHWQGGGGEGVSGVALSVVAIVSTSFTVLCCSSAVYPFLLLLLSTPNPTSRQCSPQLSPPFPCHLFSCTL